MKSVLLLLAPPLAVASALTVFPHAPQATGKVETRPAQAATSAAFSGALEVEIRQGLPKLTIEAEADALRHIRSGFSGGKLSVWTEGSFKTDRPMKVKFWTPEIRAVEAKGATKLDVDRLSGPTVRVGLSGASRVHAKGRAERLIADVVGASEAHLDRVDAVAADVKASGASKVWVSVRKRLGAAASGASEIRYKGKPNALKKDATGASSVNPD
jgi:hypothetical protein